MTFKHTPPHQSQNTVDCTCVKCEDWRVKQVVSGSLVTGVVRGPPIYRFTEHHAATWDPMGPLQWGKKIMHYPLLVLAVLPTQGRFDSHLNPVLVWSADFGFRCTSARWLNVVTSGANVSVPKVGSGK